MKVVLIRPRPHRETIGLQHVMVCEPLELEYIGAVLKGHDVVIYDMILEKKSLEEIINLEKPDLVGITGYIAHVGVMEDYAKRIKAVNSKIIVAVGGIHAEVLPNDFESSFIDYVVGSNGLKNIERIANGEKLPKYICDEKETSFNYPHPDRSLVERYKSKYYYMFHYPCALIKTSYGCPYNCSFCFCRRITDGKYFVREIDDVISELKEIPEEEVYIVDDDFLFNVERLNEFYIKLKENNIRKKYLVYGRADFIAANEEIIGKLREVGLSAVIVGLESYSDKELNNYNKKSSINISKRAVEVLHKYDIECYGTFILGLNWDKDDFNGLYRFIKRLDIQFINLQPITPMPKTDLYDEYEDKLIVKRGEFEKWDMAHLVVMPEKLSIKKYYLNIMILYYKITLSPKNTIRAIKKYGFFKCLKLSFGGNRVMGQYLIKILRGTP